MNKRIIYCCACQRCELVRLTNGKEVYPHRPDLAALPFWKCDKCGNWVGCHHKTNKPTNPLGVIATPEIKKMRMAIHRLIDPIWKSKNKTRGQVYKRLSEAVGHNFHTSAIKTMDEAVLAYREAKLINAEWAE